MHDFQPLRPIDFGHAALGQKCLHAFHIQRFAVTANHKCTGALAQPRIRHGHDGCILHPSVFIEYILHILHRNVLAAANDNVLQAPGDADKTLGIQRGEIAGVEPLAVEILLCQRCLFDIADEHKWAAALQTAFGAGRK